MKVSLAAILAGEVVAPTDTFLYFLAEEMLRAGSRGPTEPTFVFLVDVQDETIIPPMDRGGTSIQLHSDKQSAMALQKLRNAITVLRSDNPIAANFVSRYIWTLVLREEIDQPNAFSSGTFQTAPGLVLVCNSHLERIGTGEIVEAMVHEAIHSYLFWTETRNRRILRRQSDYRAKVASPWTGAYIGTHSAVHAIGVWYGLLKHFERVICSARGEHREYALDRVAFIRSGFLSPRFDELVAELMPMCAPFGVSLVKRIAAVGRAASDATVRPN